MTHTDPTSQPPPLLQWSSQAVLDVAAERRRQIEGEGWTPERDDQYQRGQLRQAAACYALFNTIPTPTMWPWAPEWWKPAEDHRRNLVKAAALILAEIERLDRAAAVPKWKTCSRCHDPTYCREHLHGCDLDEMAR